MANIKISELEEITTVENDDLLAIVDNSANETKKIKYNNIIKDYIKIIELKYDQSFTIAGHGSLEVNIEVPTIPGYTYVACLGGAGSGLTGLLVSSSVGYFNRWVYNTRDNQGTWNGVDFTLLYVKTTD